jgi:hypothetical protein
MKPLIPQEFAKFERQYKFAGGRLLRIRQTFRKGQLEVEMILRVTPTIKNLDDDPKPVKLHFRFIGVDEMRFQKRPGSSAGKIGDAHFGSFQSMYFLTLDSWSLLPNERPGVHDFRGSDWYLGCQEILWEQLPSRKPT